jgi:hypothetical protein
LGYFLYGPEPDAPDVAQFAALTAINTDNLSDKRAITTAAVDHAEYVPAANYDPTTGTLSSFRPNLAVIAQGGRWYRVNLNVGSSLSLDPLSTPGAYNQASNMLCQDIKTIGGINPNQTYILYETAGADNDCTKSADNKRFQLNTMLNGFIPSSDITSKVSSVSDVIEITSPTDPTQTPFALVAINGKDLMRYDDVQFNAPSLIASATNSVEIDIQEGFHTGGFFVRIDNSVYWYDQVNNKLSASLYTAATQQSLAAQPCDATHCYFVETVFSPTPAGKIVRIPWGGTSAAQTVANAVPGYVGQVLPAGTSLFIAASNFTGSGSGTSSLQIMAKSGGNLTTLDTGTFVGMMSAGNYVYYTKMVIPGSGNGVSAVARNLDGTVAKETPNAAWTGASFTSMSLNGGQTSSFAPTRLVLASNLSATSGQINMAGATLQSYNAATNEVQLTLGTVPADLSSVVLYGFANRMFGFGNDATQTDIIAADLDRANSFTRVTQTPQIEQLVE